VFSVEIQKKEKKEKRKKEKRKKEVFCWVYKTMTIQVGFLLFT